jgi:hypothetical protein
MEQTYRQTLWNSEPNHSVEEKTTRNSVPKHSPRTLVPSFGIDSTVDLGMPRNEHFLPRNNGNRSESIPRIFFGTKFSCQPYLQEDMADEINNLLGRYLFTIFLSFSSQIWPIFWRWPILDLRKHPFLHIHAVHRLSWTLLAHLCYRYCKTVLQLRALNIFRRWLFSQNRKLFISIYPI